MADMSYSAHAYSAHAYSAHAYAAGGQKEADGPFLRRILIGLIAATLFSGAVTLTLTSQYDLVERLQTASADGPA